MKFKLDKKPGHWTVIDLCPGCGCPSSAKARGTEQQVRAAYEGRRIYCRLCEADRKAK